MRIVHMETLRRSGAEPADMGAQSKLGTLCIGFTRSLLAKQAPFSLSWRRPLAAAV